jgi:lipoic acid synthetase
MGECWASGTATFMVLGDTCTRGCRFCAVKTHSQGTPVDLDEPEKVAEACVAMGLKYVVLTMVDRDDLPDGGSRPRRRDDPRDQAAQPGHAGRSAGRRLARHRTPDRHHRADDRHRARRRPDVYAHNVETVLRLTPRVRDHRCSYVRSLATLRTAKQLQPDVVTKSSLMLGLGESEREVEQAMDDLREYGVDVVTFGQYLRPTLLHLPVREHVTPARFAALEARAMTKGFLYVAAGPLVRSSYKAAEFYLAGMLRQRKAIAKPPAPLRPPPRPNPHEPRTADDPRQGRQGPEGQGPEPAGRRAAEALPADGDDARCSTTVVSRCSARAASASTCSRPARRRRTSAPPTR